MSVGLVDGAHSRDGRKYIGLALSLCLVYAHNLEWDVVEVDPFAQVWFLIGK